MVNLSSLCSDVLLLIIEHVRHSSLPSLAATNQTFPPLINPILYHTADWILDEVEDDEPSRFPLLLWFRTLCKRPDLAAFVKHLVFTSSIRVNWDQHTYKSVLSPDDKELFLEAANKLDGIPFAQELKEGIVNGSDDALKAVMVSKLLNMETLEIEYSQVSTFKLVGLMLQFLGSSSKLRKLNKVYFRNDCDVGSMQNDTVCYEPMFALFHITSLETIEMLMPEPVYIDLPLENGMLPNLQTLRLLNSKASVSTLSHLLFMTPNLHTLEYNFVQDLDKLRFDELHEEVHHGEWTDLSIALEPLQKTLKNLSISICYFYDERWDTDEDDEVEWMNQVWDRRGCMSSLESFTALERLEIPLLVLLGWTPNFAEKKLRDVLPSGLKELCLRDDLVDGYKGYNYEWTPWESEIADSVDNLDTHFDTFVNCGPTILQLEDYLAFNNNDTSALHTVTFKQTQGRQWPAHAKSRISEICRLGRVRGRFQGYAMNDGDWVIETTVWNPLNRENNTKFQYRLFCERRKVLYKRYCEVTDESE